MGRSNNHCTKANNPVRENPVFCNDPLLVQGGLSHPRIVRRAREAQYFPLSVVSKGLLGLAVVSKGREGLCLGQCQRPRVRAPVSPPSGDSDCMPFVSVRSVPVCRCLFCHVRLVLSGFSGMSSQSNEN